MPSGSLVLWFPDLKSHGLGENLLRELVLRAHGSGDIVGGFVVDDMRSLSIGKPSFVDIGTIERTLATMR